MLGVSCYFRDVLDLFEPKLRFNWHTNLVKYSFSMTSHPGVLLFLKCRVCGKVETQQSGSSNEGVYRTAESQTSDCMPSIPAHIHGHPSRDIMLSLILLLQKSSLPTFVIFIYVLLSCSWMVTIKSPPYEPLLYYYKQPLRHSVAWCREEICEGVRKSLWPVQVDKWRTGSVWDVFLFL